MNDNPECSCPASMTGHAPECPWVNGCEHGDHPAPEGQRFCSRECEECEHTDHDAEHADCAGICLRKVDAP